MGGVGGAKLKQAAGSKSSLFKMQSPSFIMKIHIHTTSDFSNNLSLFESLDFESVLYGIIYLKVKRESLGI